MFDISAYSLALLAHVTAATILVGSTLFAPLVHRSVLSVDSLGALRMWLDFLRRSSRANPAAALVVLGTGVYLGSLGWWEQPWFYVALAAWLANSLLATLVVKRVAATLGTAIGSRDGAVDMGVDRIRQTRAWGLAEQVMRANDLAMLYVMFNKPSPIESLLVVAGAIGLSIAVGRGSARASGAISLRTRSLGSSDRPLAPATQPTLP